MKTPIFSSISGQVYVISLIFSLTLSGCGSDSSSDTPSTNTTGDITTEVAALGDNVKNIQLIAGAETRIKFTYTVPGDITTGGDYSINLTKTLENTTLSTSPVASNTAQFETLRLLAQALVKNAFAADPSTGTVTAYISYTDDPLVCSSPYKFGPYSITGMVDSALSSETTSVTPDATAVDIFNAGSFEVCMVINSPIDAFLTVSSVPVDFEPCAEPSADIVGVWEGTYQCTNFEGTVTDPPGSFVRLTITKNSDGSHRYEDDGGAVYNGHLCGNKFRFNGGLEDAYTESGTMTVVDGSSATKTSIWLNIAKTFGGTCSDVLQKL
jgi:hypothetical protein